MLRAAGNKNQERSVEILAIMHDTLQNVDFHTVCQTLAQPAEDDETRGVGSDEATTLD